MRQILGVGTFENGVGHGFDVGMTIGHIKQKRLFVTVGTANFLGKLRAKTAQSSFGETL